MYLILIGLISLFGSAVILGFWAVAKYNTLISFSALAKEAWSGVDVQLQRRYDLIPNLVATVKQYGVHEKDVLENITKFRVAAMNAQNLQEKSAQESAFTGTLKTLFAVAENYPELKANENFLQLQKSLEALESEIQIARRYYNGTIRNYNIAIQQFPANIIAKTTSFTPLSFFELNNAEGRNNPRVSF